MTAPSFDPTRINILKDIGKLLSTSKNIDEAKEGFKKMVLELFEINF
jgi:hypothetical protein